MSVCPTWAATPTAIRPPMMPCLQQMRRFQRISTDADQTGGEDRRARAVNARQTRAGAVGPPGDQWEEAGQWRQDGGEGSRRSGVSVRVIGTRTWRRSGSL